MNLRGFLNAVYTLFVEASIALGKDVFTALEEMKTLQEPAPAIANGNAAPTPRRNEAAQNDAAYMDFMARLSGSDFGKAR